MVTLEAYVDGHHITTVQVCVCFFYKIKTDQTVCEALYRWSPQHHRSGAHLVLAQIKPDRTVCEA